MYSIIRQGDSDSAGVLQFVCDTDNDVNDIPTDICQPGSSCISLATSSVYILGNDKIWHKL